MWIHQEWARKWALIPAGRRAGFAGSGIVLFLVAACGSPQSVFVLGAGLANFVYTDQVPTDYIAEYASGKQCSLLKAIEDGGPLCRDSFERQIVEKPVYCYRTIGQPTCYTAPDPYGTGAQQIR